MSKLPREDEFWLKVAANHHDGDRTEVRELPGGCLVRYFYAAIVDDSVSTAMCFVPGVTLSDFLRR